ncbi:MAG: hypothetical protein M1819_004903 [Sarea resinae]|nr:MAG: hypothetical protein M1819_004903 [Sarea resinae]
MAERTSRKDNFIILIRYLGWKSLFRSEDAVFQTLVDQTVTVELKNDISIRGTLKSVDQFLNIKLDDIQVMEELKYPHLPWISCGGSDMFRKPRENDFTPPTSVKPSTGRPPTPPQSSENTHRPPQNAVAMASRQPTKPLSAKPTGNSNSAGRTRKGTLLSNGKIKPKPNSSILTFFKKVESPVKPAVANGDDDELFYVDDASAVPPSRARSPTPDPLFEEQKQDRADSDAKSGQEIDSSAVSRFNENTSSVKRRKKFDTGSFLGDTAGGLFVDDDAREDDISGNPSALPQDAELARANKEAQVGKGCSPPPPELNEIMTGNVAQNDSELSDSKQSTYPDAAKPELQPPKKRMGGRISLGGRTISGNNLGKSILRPRSSNSQTLDSQHQPYSNEPSPNRSPDQPAIPLKPPLKHESTSVKEDGQFDEIEGFGNDEDPDDEDFLEKQSMEEQKRLEMAENGLLEDGFEGGLDDLPIKDDDSDTELFIPFEESGPTCPICNSSLSGVDDAEASVHVNHCLDGNPTPLPDRKEDVAVPKYKKEDGTLTPRRFQPPVRPAKPGQENPFVLGQASTSSSSAFSKLMSSHAEDTAWATAAAAETASRGKPSYQRTCPFYKILPGLFICVDAFRYGAVEGCNAYFLSHFHSDHYVGLTSHWQNGPIYCSRVTANLVRGQLRVDPKWVVELEFEEKSEIPGTNGVHCTMIPANHCPGSSLFLFEKVVGKGKNPKVQRVLHCGDFRACPAHVEHPLLRPNILDSATGRAIAQQKIDVCYLDTTYLNPKYAFPNQTDVIAACADMCVSLSKDQVDTSDSFESMKRDRAGSGMAKFVRQNSTSGPTNNETDDPTNLKLGKPGRGRLLVVVGTYSIGKERICVGIAQALGSKIYATSAKTRICNALEDPILSALLTSDPADAQVHMTPLFEIRADTLAEYLESNRAHNFSRIVGFRPSGWNYRPPNTRFVESPQVNSVLYGSNWRSGYSMRDLVPQRGSTSKAMCFGVPYSEHSSFRELTMFCCALRIDRVIPTVNVGSAKGRERMRGWIERWEAERRKNGLFRLGEGEGMGMW